MENYSEERLKYLEDPEKYWIEKVKSLTWFENWKKVHNYEPDKHNNQWFIGGKINVSYELLDKKVKDGHGDDVAFVVDSPFTKTVKKHTIRDILDMVSRVAGVLSDCGIREGDPVSIYLPMIAESVVSMLAVVRLGAVYGILNSMKPETALANRIDDFKPKVIITTNCEFNSKGEVFNPKQYIDDVLQQCEHQPEQIIVLQRKNAKPAKLFQPRDLDWDEALTTAKPHDCVPIEINQPVFVIYTSGSTGKPKGLVLTTLYIIGNNITAAETIIGTVPKPGESKAMFSATFFCWIGAHYTALYMPLHQRIPVILWEKSAQDAPIEEVLQMLTDHKVTSMYMPTQTIRVLIKQDPKGEISSLYKNKLKIEHVNVGSVPGDVPTFAWINKYLTEKHAQLYGLTECGIMTVVDTGNGRTFSDHPCMSVGSVIPGRTVKILRPDGSEADTDEVGRIVLKLPMTTLSSGFFGDENRQRFISTYLTTFPGYFDTNDEGRFDSKGNIYVTNRADSVFKIAGSRISCDALEEVIMRHKDVAECVVVTRIQKDLNELPVGVFVTNKMAQKSGKEIACELEELVSKQLGNWITFDEMIHVKAIAKNSSGKIPRGTIKEIVRNSEKGQINPTTIENGHQTV